MTSAVYGLRVPNAISWTGTGDCEPQKLQSANVFAQITHLCPSLCLSPTLLLWSLRGAVLASSELIALRFTVLDLRSEL